jgi:integrase
MGGTMSYLFEKTGLIRDRSSGYREISYYVPKHSKTFLRLCKTAHDTIMGIIPQERRKTITPQEVKQMVVQYVTLDEEAKREFIRGLILPTPTITLPYNSGVENLGTHTLKELFERWKEGKQEGFSNELKFERLEFTLFNFFKEYNLKTTNDLNFQTGQYYVNWRTKTRYKKGGTFTSASVVKKELDILRQMVKLATMYGWFHNGNIWDNVKVKSVVGINKKIVEPLEIEEQKNMLEQLKQTHVGCHDLALFLLITGIRLGELEVIKPDSIKNDLIFLHGNFIGNHKTTGKTNSANRNLPVCPTIRKLFERGYIFKTTGNALSVKLKRSFKGIHPHKLRHTFAVNKLLSGENLQMVSYQMGHKGTGITADLYGKYEHKHFKVGLEQTKTERKELLKWLEEDYF